MGSVLLIDDEEKLRSLLKRIISLEGYAVFEASGTRAALKILDKESVPFETLIIPKRAMARITEMTTEERNAFADAYKRIAVRYDNLFEISFPYSAGIHQAPSDGAEHPEWHWHMSFYPPLLRSASVKKFMVGYEMLANPQRDVTPEFSAAKLRSLSEQHYKQKS